MKIRIIHTLTILACSVVLGTLLLVVTFCLPVESAREHVKESLYEMIEIVQDENGDPLRKEIISLKENFTDALMVQNALEKVEGKSPLSHAMYAYHYDIRDETETTWLTEASLVKFLKDGTEGLYLREYSRYWHGYLVILKPLLMCMSWRQVENFLFVLQILLLLIVVGTAFYKKKPLLGLGVVVAFLFMKPIRVWISLAMSVCWNITLIAILMEILFYEKISGKKWQDEFFLLIGIITAYMDFLTYPIVTLGVPLCVYLMLNSDTVMSPWKRIRQTFWMCFSWGAGYIGMWSMKWVVAELTCQAGTLREAIWAVIFRTEPLDGYGSAFTGVHRTLQSVLNQYDSDFYAVLFVVLVAAALVSALWCCVKARNKDWGVTLLCLAVVALFPFIWLVLTQNHTAIHCVFTFRIMGVTIMALWCIVVSSIQTIERMRRENIEEK